MTDEERGKFLELLALAPPGARIEFGVFRGETLALIAADGEPTIGVDSFEGMPEPGEFDFADGINPYPRGRFAVPMSTAWGSAPSASLVKGVVPDVLDRIGSTGFAFAHVDLDHYASTLALLHWLWPRMKPGGVIVCDDWFPDRDYLAAKAINEFAQKVGDPQTFGRKAWWVL